MQRRRLVFACFLLSLPLLPFLLKLATNANTSQVSQVSDAAHVEDFRAELLMALDLFVRAERVIHAETGAYSRSLGRIPDVFGALTSFYRIEVARATQNKLLVIAIGETHHSAVPIETRQSQSAFSDSAALIGDRVAVDENFQVRSNFPLPLPPRDYLHALARVVMNKIFANQFVIPGRQELDRHEGIFHGHFRYEIKPVSNGGRTIVAVGISNPVIGDIVEMQPGANVFEWVYQHRNSHRVESEIYGQLEKIYLAERIFHDHVGSYSGTFSGLLSISNDLAILTADRSAISIQELQLDPTFGFHAEITERQGSNSKSERAPSSMRTLSVNGYGQVSEVASVEMLMGQFEQAQKKVRSHGYFLPSPPKPLQRDPLTEPLLIDAVDPEK